MKKLFVAALAVVSVISFGFAQNKPLWDLARDEIPPALKSGTVEKVDTPYTFTLAVRDGYATFYVDERPYKKCFMAMAP